SQSGPDDAPAVDVDATGREATDRRLWIVEWWFVDLGQTAPWVDPDDRAGQAARNRDPHGTIARVRDNPVARASDPSVLARIDWLIWLGIGVELPVPIGVKDVRTPALRVGDIAGRLERLRVQPAQRAAIAHEPQCVVGVVGELQVLRGIARVD